MKHKDWPKPVKCERGLRVDLRRVDLGVRHFQDTPEGREKAEALCADVREAQKKFGTSMSEFSLAEWQDAAAALTLLRESSMISEVTLVECVKCFREEHLEALLVGHSKAIEKYLKYRRGEGASLDHLDSIQRVLCRYADDVTSLHDSGLSSNSVRQYWGILNSFYAWAVRGGYASRNPMTGIACPRKEHKEIKILSVEDARSLCFWYRDNCGRLLPTLLLRLFAGMRLSEIHRIGVGSVATVSNSHAIVQVPPSASKTGVARVIEAPESLGHLLIGYAGANGLFGWDKQTFTRAKRELGIEVPRNAMRKSFVSYHLALHENAAKTAMYAGHDPRVGLEYYKALATKEQGGEYFEIPYELRAKVGARSPRHD